MFFNYKIVIVNTLPAHRNFNGYSVKFLKISDIQLQIIIIFGVIKYNVTYLKLKTPPTTYKFFRHFKTILYTKNPQCNFLNKIYTNTLPEFQSPPWSYQGACSHKVYMFPVSYQPPGCSRPASGSTHSEYRSASAC